MKVCQRCKRHTQCIEWQYNILRYNLTIIMCQHCWANWALHMMGGITCQFPYGPTKMLEDFKKFANPQ
jgi:hypothetical protein